MSRLRLLAELVEWWDVVTSYGRKLRSIQTGKLGSRQAPKLWKMFAQITDDILKPPFISLFLNHC